MAEQFEALTDDLIDFIGRQHLFFVSTAGAAGRINLSPKGMDTLRIINPRELVWLNLTGSGNETAAHVLENGRMTIMCCSFDKQPLILRLYGHADIVYPRHDARWRSCAALFEHQPGARQFFEFHLDMALTSCGFGVPVFEFRRERDTLAKWAANKGTAGIAAYWEEKNQVSLDGRPTEILPG